MFRSLKNALKSDKVTSGLTSRAVSSSAMPFNPISSAPFGSAMPFNPKARPANFDSPDYRPCGRMRIEFKADALKEVNSIWLIDDSTSTIMKRYAERGRPLNWDVMASVAPQLFDIINQNDPDGACLYFLNHKSNIWEEPGVPEDGLADTGYNQIQNPDYMMELMNKARPGDMQGTPTGPRIKYITDAYLKRCADKSKPRPRPISLIVWTDGESNDDDELVRVILNICRELQRLGMPKGQIGIQFFQVGNIERATATLKRLDDELTGENGVLDDNGEYWDIVDTRKQSDLAKTGFTAQAVMELLLGGFVKQIDKLKNGQAPVAAPEDEFTL